MTAPPRLDDLDGPPVVGATYLVRCVVVGGKAGRLSGVALPIMGGRHGDADHGLAEDHYHYHPQFIDLRHVLLATLGPTPAASALLIAHVADDPVELRPLVCLREMPPYPADCVAWLRDLEAAYTRQRSDCRTCPHRGGDLRQLPRDAVGTVTCRLHGLRWGPDGAARPRSIGYALTFALSRS